MPSLSKHAMEARYRALERHALPHYMNLVMSVRGTLESSMVWILRARCLSLDAENLQNIWINFVNEVDSDWSEYHADKDTDRILDGMRSRAGIDSSTTITGSMVSEHAEAFFAEAGEMVELLLQMPVFPSPAKCKQVLCKLDLLVGQVASLLGGKYKRMHAEEWEARYRAAIDKDTRGCNFLCF